MLDGNPLTYKTIGEFMDNVWKTSGGTGLGAAKKAYQALSNYSDYCANIGNNDFTSAYEEHIRHAFEEPVRKKMSEIKSGIVYIPEDTTIDPEYLTKSGLTNDEFVKAFRGLQEIVYNVYDAIEITSPFEWGWGDWQHLAVNGIDYNRIFKTIALCLAYNNTLDDDIMIVNRKTFFSWDWNAHEKDKSKTTLVKMAEFGFELEGIDDKSDTFKVSCIRNPHIMRVIHALEGQLEKCGNLFKHQSIQDPATLPLSMTFNAIFLRTLTAYASVEAYDDGHTFWLNGKKIASITDALRLWLKDIFQEENEREITALPGKIKSKFKRRARKPCPCGEQYCYKNNRNEKVFTYTYEGDQYEMCEKSSFIFKDLSIEFIPFYIRMLELEYGLTKV